LTGMPRTNSRWLFTCVCWEGSLYSFGVCVN
jgi:hypothetical protein